jgi:hypothetical protein
MHRVAKNPAPFQAPQPLRDLTAAANPTTEQFRRLSFVLDKLTARKAPYSTAERFIVLAIVRAMGVEHGRWVAFMSHKGIAERTGSSVRTVGRLLDKHCNGPAPLLARQTPRFGERFTTRGKDHACARFELVFDPQAFAEKRDQARAARPKQQKLKAAAERPAVAAAAAVVPQPEPLRQSAPEPVADLSAMLSQLRAQIAARPPLERRPRAVASR